MGGKLAFVKHQTVYANEDSDRRRVEVILDSETVEEVEALARTHPHLGGSRVEALEVLVLLGLMIWTEDLAAR